VSWLGSDEFAPTVARLIVVWNINRCWSGDRVDEPPVPGHCAGWLLKLRRSLARTLESCELAGVGLVWGATVLRFSPPFDSGGARIATDLVPGGDPQWG
jgi:hypothetical protein